ncbi:unnamed protein product [Cyclocybe aegerita]|uniref:Uncharacterized protein n=1 Tax=Cyclocybe aegerita TaxID=1973307 RepID=A0A8S0VU59_CYCAE|nr:unnamed protein product [Cyclocybe aegerita]
MVHEAIISDIDVTFCTEIQGPPEDMGDEQCRTPNSRVPSPTDSENGTMFYEVLSGPFPPSDAELASSRQPSTPSGGDDSSTHSVLNVGPAAYTGDTYDNPSYLPELVKKWKQFQDLPKGMPDDMHVTFGWAFTLEHQPEKPLSIDDPMFHQFRRGNLNKFRRACIATHGRGPSKSYSAYSVAYSTVHGVRDVYGNSAPRPTVFGKRIKEKTQLEDDRYRIQVSYPDIAWDVDPPFVQCAEYLTLAPIVREINAETANKMVPVTTLTICDRKAVTKDLPLCDHCVEFVEGLVKKNRGLRVIDAVNGRIYESEVTKQMWEQAQNNSEH